MRREWVPPCALLEGPEDDDDALRAGLLWHGEAR
jgi:hypothetical protein